MCGRESVVKKRVHIDTWQFLARVEGAVDNVKGIFAVTCRVDSRTHPHQHDGGVVATGGGSIKETANTSRALSIFFCECLKDSGGREVVLTHRLLFSVSVNTVVPLIVYLPSTVAWTRRSSELNYEDEPVPALTKQDACGEPR